MSLIVVQLNCTVNNKRTQIILDTINDVVVQSSSDITMHPIVTGDMVADHMIRQPVTMHIAGSFSLNGRSKTIATGAGSRLSNLEELFENIKNEGSLCDITKMSVEDNGIRFLQRRNMVLTGISWTEKINSVAFTFDFTQALLADIQTYEVDVDDQFLPNISEPNTLNFTECLLDWSQIDKLITSTAVQVGLMTEDFKNFLHTTSTYAVTGVVAGVTVGVTTTAVIVSLGASGPVGWIIGAIAAVVIVGIGIVKAISDVCKANKYRVKQFQYYKDDRKNAAEVERYNNFIGQIHKQMTQLNNKIFCWQIAANEEQECMVSISNNYYIFNFTKNNTNARYMLTVTDVDGKQVGASVNIASSPRGMFECTSSNCLFRAAQSGAYVYIIKATDDSQTEASNENDLRNYVILATLIRPEEFTNVLVEIIKNAMLK